MNEERIPENETKNHRAWSFNKRLFDNILVIRPKFYFLVRQENLFEYLARRPRFPFPANRLGFYFSVNWSMRRTRRIPELRFKITKNRFGCFPAVGSSPALNGFHCEIVTLITCVMTFSFITRYKTLLFGRYHPQKKIWFYSSQPWEFISAELRRWRFIYVIAGRSKI